MREAYASKPIRDVLIPSQLYCQQEEHTGYEQYYAQQQHGRGYQPPQVMIVQQPQYVQKDQVVYAQQPYQYAYQNVLESDLKKLQILSVLWQIWAQN